MKTSYTHLHNRYKHQTKHSGDLCWGAPTYLSLWSCGQAMSPDKTNTFYFHFYKLYLERTNFRVYIFPRILQILIDFAKLNTREIFL